MMIDDKIVKDLGETVRSLINHLETLGYGRDPQAQIDYWTIANAKEVLKDYDALGTND